MSADAGLVEAHVEPLHVVIPIPNGWSLTINDSTGTLVAFPSDDSSGGEDTTSITLRARAFTGGWPEVRGIAAETVSALSSTHPGFRLLHETNDPEDLRARWTFRYDDAAAGPRTQLQSIVFDGELFITTCTSAEADFGALADLFGVIAHGVCGKID